MAEVAGRSVFVIANTSGEKFAVFSFTTAATADTITFSSGTEYAVSTIVWRIVQAQGTGDALSSATIASNQITLGVSTGVQSGYGAMVGY